MASPTPQIMTTPKYTPLNPLSLLKPTIKAVMSTLPKPLPTIHTLPTSSQGQSSSEVICDDPFYFHSQIQSIRHQVQLTLVAPESLSSLYSSSHPTATVSDQVLVSHLDS